MWNRQLQESSNQIGIRTGNVSHTTIVKCASFKRADYIDGRIKQEILTEVRQKNPVEMDCREDKWMTVGLPSVQNVRSSE